MLVTILFLLNINARALTIDEAFRSALQKNERAGQAAEEVKQAEERLDQAKSGPLPNLAFNATHLIQERVDDPVAREFFPENQTTTNLTLTQPLFRGMREFAALRQQGRLLDAQKQARIATLAKMYEDVATAYLQILAFEADIRNVDELLGYYGQRVKDLSARARRGESQGNEVLTAQSSTAALEAERSLTEGKLRAARENFAFLTGLAADVKLDENNLQPPAVQKLDNYLAGVEKRPDIQGAKEKVEAADAEVKIKRGSHWPSLDAVGNYYFQRPGYLSVVDWDVQFKLTVPIFEGGLRLAETAEAASKRRHAELELSRLRREASSSIRSLHEGLQLRIRQVAALEKSMDLARRSYQVLQRDFRRGLTRNVEVQMALTELGVSRRNFDQARFSAQLEKIRIDMASALFPDSLRSQFE